MDIPRQSVESDQSDSETPPSVRRRRLLTVGSSVGAMLLAGCASETPASDSDDDTATTTGASSSTPTDADETTAEAGAFRLLISDRPAAIDDFDELNVSLDRARIFRDEGSDDEETEADDATSTTTDAEATETEAGTATEAETATATGTPTATETATTTETPTATETPATTETETPAETATESADDDSDDDSDGEERGFFVIDLDGATVDLTRVVGDKAIGVFDGELEAGRYAKVELYAADVEGIVDGETVDVKIPSGKLQLTKPFEVVPGETLSFVFDINVVKKGRSDAYNLLPVISESGVAGHDVDVEEVGGENGDESDDTTETETDDGTAGSGSENGSDRSQNDSDDAATDS